MGGTELIICNIICMKTQDALEQIYFLEYPLHVLFKLVLMRHMQIQEHRNKLIRFFWKLTKGR